MASCSRGASLGTSVCVLVVTAFTLGQMHGKTGGLTSFSPSQGGDPTDVSQPSVQPSNAERPALRAILHVGPHKTGSTSLQVTLHRGRKTLAEDNFAVCPSRFPGGRWSHSKSCANVANCLHTGPGRGAGLTGINCTLVLAHF